MNMRGVNLVTEADTYHMASTQECLHMRNARVFTKIDLKSGFWQIKIAKKDRYKTAFRFEGRTYEWLVMPFGLRNAPATFQRLIDKILKGVSGRFCHGYLDDIIIFSKT